MRTFSTNPALSIISHSKIVFTINHILGILIGIILISLLKKKFDATNNTSAPNDDDYHSDVEMARSISHDSDNHQDKHSSESSSSDEDENEDDEDEDEYDQKDWWKKKKIPNTFSHSDTPEVHI